MKIELNEAMEMELDALCSIWERREVTFKEVIEILQCKLFSIYVLTDGDKWRESLIHVINTTHFGEGCPCCGGKG